MTTTTAPLPARKSQRVSGVEFSDGDIWQEKLAVCEGVKKTGEPDLLIRSYYRNLRTRERVWDEPPSGAGTVLHATVESRQQAEFQRSELQLTLEMIPEDESNPSKKSSPKKSKKGLFQSFRGKKKKKRPQVDTSKDVNLQRAIAKSMAEQFKPTGGGMDEPTVLYDTGDNDDDDIALAKALSISAMETDHNMEDEDIQKAVQQSREEVLSKATGVAKLPPPEPSFMFEESSASLKSSFVGKSDPNERSQLI